MKNFLSNMAIGGWCAFVILMILALCTTPLLFWIALAKWVFQ